jgi:hypothetical protein
MTPKEKIFNKHDIITMAFNKQKVFLAMDEYADDFAIGFAEWAYRNEYNIGFYFKQDTTKELLEIYKKEKGL